MELATVHEDVYGLINKLTFKEKVDRSLALIEDSYKKFGDSLIVANSLGKDSVAIWDLAKKVSPKIRGFIVTTRYKPPETIRFMKETIAQYPELLVYQSDDPLHEKLYLSDPDRCCYVLKVKPTRKAILEMGARCWVTGLRCTEGRTRIEYKEIEERDPGLIKLNPILLWKEREVWQYLALNRVKVNPLYGAGYRSLGCLPCTNISSEENERAGRWAGTSKCGGECGIHTRPLK